MGGDDSQKLLPWRGAYSSPGRSKPALWQINTLPQGLSLGVQTHLRSVMDGPWSPQRMLQSVNSSRPR
jgi:hypothetical protein